MVTAKYTHSVALDDESEERLNELRKRGRTLTGILKDALKREIVLQKKENTVK